MMHIHILLQTKNTYNYLIEISIIHSSHYNPLTLVLFLPAGTCVCSVIAFGSSIFSISLVDGAPEIRIPTTDKIETNNVETNNNPSTTII